MIMGRVIAVCISEKRGTQKKNIKEGNFVEDYGIENDAHAGNWHRQVSLLSYEKIKEFNNKGANVIDGAFGENLVVEGIEFTNLPIGAILKCNDVILELTQIGKECHNHCEIYRKMGDCIMPRNGVFAKVIAGGKIKCGDEMKVV
jgi:MOSC domain-containing protein YiiM